MPKELFDRQRRRVGAEPLRWRPAADIHRTGEGWLVKFELAGVREEHVELRLLGRHLLLRGSRYDTPPPGALSHSMEIAYSHFERLIELPSGAGRARLVSEFQAGMLLVRIITEEEEHEHR